MRSSGGLLADNSILVDITSTLVLGVLTGFAVASFAKMMYDVFKPTEG